MVSCDIEATSHTGRTALLWAAAKGHHDVLEQLLVYGELVVVTRE